MSDLSYDQLKAMGNIVHLLHKLDLLTFNETVILQIHYREKASLDAREQLAQDIRDEVAAFERAYA